MSQKTELDYLNETTIRSTLSSVSQAVINRIEIFDKIDSTNTYLLSKKNQNTAIICLADYQTHGRGRFERRWQNSPGNIYCSMLWPFELPFEFTGSLSVAVAVMVLRALYTYGFQGNLQLKWPNDLWLNGKKLAGILLESNRPQAIVIGMGLNIHTPPEEYNGIGLESFSSEKINRNQLISCLLNELVAGLINYQHTGLSSFYSFWQQHDGLLGKKITITTPTFSWQGIARGITEKGELKIQDEQNNLRIFSVGEVSVRVKT